MNDYQKLFMLVRTLDETRTKLNDAKEEEERRLTVLERLAEYMIYQNAVKDRKDSAITEGAVKKDVGQLAIQIAEQTGEKKFPGVTVTEGTVTTFDPDLAKEYCMVRKLGAFFVFDADKFAVWLKANMEQGKEVVEQLGLSVVNPEMKTKYGTRVDSDLSPAIADQLLKMGSVSDLEVETSHE